MSTPSALFSPVRLDAVRESGLTAGASLQRLDGAVRVVVAACGVPVAVVLLIDDRALHLATSHGLDEHERAAVTTLSIPLSRTIAARAVLGDGPVMLSNVRRDARYRADPLANAGMAAVLAVPLVVRGQAIGVLAACDRVPHQWDTEQRESLESLALLSTGKLLEPERATDSTAATTFASHLPDAVIQIDRDGRIVALNHGASAMLHLPTPEVLGTPLSRVLPVSVTSDDLSESIWRTIHEQRETTTELVRPDIGDWIELRGFPTDQGATIVMRDVTERKEREARLFHEAYHDPLTQLPNRRLLLDRMQQSLAHARRNASRVAVLYLDLDNFKRVNDSLGHDAGDQLLIEVARRLRALLREEDTAARLGGDEFVVLLPHVPDPEGAVEVAQRVITSLHQEMAIGRHRIAPVTSIGVAMSSSPDESPEDLLARADAAMYQSKTTGKNRYTIAPFPERGAVGERRADEHAAPSMPSSPLGVVFQPQLSLPLNQVIAFEAVLHWQHPDRSLLPGSDVLAVARRIGADQDMDRLVLRQSLATLQSWRGHASLSQTKLAINLTLSTIANPGFASELLRTLSSMAIAPSYIEIEIPVALLAIPSHVSQKTLLSLAGAGCTVVVDDPDGEVAFHESSIGWPVTGVKVRATVLHGHKRTVARLQASGIHLTAIDVDTPLLLEQVRAAGVDRVQGRTVGLPVPAHDVPGVVSSRRSG